MIDYLELEQPSGITGPEDIKVPIIVSGREYMPNTEQEKPPVLGIDALFGSLSLDNKVDEWIMKLSEVVNG